MAATAHAPRRLSGFPRFAAWLRSLSGWRRAAAAFVLGACVTAALPPVHALPFLFVAFPGLVWLIEGCATGRAALSVGWWFGFGNFVTGLYWIAFALLVDAAQFGWMVPFAVFGLSAYFAIYPAAAAWALWRSRARGIAGAIVLALAWTAAEWLRGHVLTGFPWNLTASVWVAIPTMIQPAAWLGAYGLGLAGVLASALLATIAQADARPGRHWAGPGLAVVLLAAWWAAGTARLAGADDAIVDGVRLRLVQPAIEQNLHSDPARTEREFLGTVALTRSAGFEGRTVVIWPESGVPYELSNNQPLRQGLAAQVVPADGLFMSGGVRTAGARTPNFQVWNTLYALDARGEIRGLFDKFHLVPFGEYMPLRSIVSLAKITAGNVDFSTGPGNVTLDLPGLPRVSPLICYEIIFPGAVVDGGDRPGWIVNVTNDAWFGITSGPYQHFAAARLRAVEEGLPVVRSANNGVSGVIDAYGRVTRVLDLGLRGVIDADLPVALPPTLYGRLGDWAVLILGIATVLVLIPLMAKRVRLTH